MRKFKVNNLYICGIAKNINKEYKLVEESNDSDLESYNVKHIYIIAREVSIVNRNWNFNVPTPTVYEEVFSKAKMLENGHTCGVDGRYFVYSATPIKANKNKITEAEALSILEDLNSCTGEKQLVKKMNKYSK